MRIKDCLQLRIRQNAKHNFFPEIGFSEGDDWEMEITGNFENDDKDVIEIDEGSSTVRNNSSPLYEVE